MPMDSSRRSSFSPARSADGSEGSILDGLRELGMTARSAAALGLELKRFEQFRSYDFSRLTRAEKATFDELVAKTSTYRDGDDAAASDARSGGRRLRRRLRRTRRRNRP
jgi:hypothetical protein